jgi:hypothetical protein
MKRTKQPLAVGKVVGYVICKDRFTLTQVFGGFGARIEPGMFQMMWNDMAQPDTRRVAIYSDYNEAAGACEEVSRQQGSKAVIRPLILGDIE